MKRKKKADETFKEKKIMKEKRKKKEMKTRFKVNNDSNNNKQ